MGLIRPGENKMNEDSRGSDKIKRGITNGSTNSAFKEEGAKGAPPHHKSLFSQTSFKKDIGRD